jgi:hypothetical protein
MFDGEEDWLEAFFRLFQLDSLGSLSDASASGTEFTPPPGIIAASIPATSRKMR